MRYTVKIILSIVLFLTVCFSQAITISGTVTDLAGAALEGAVVHLEQHGFKDTTDVNGNFILTGTTVNVDNSYDQSFQKKIPVSIRNGMIFVDVKKASDFKVLTYNIQGKIISSIQKKVTTGKNNIAIPNMNSGVYIHRIKLNNYEALLKNNSICCSNFSSTVYSKDQSLINSANKSDRYNVINDVIKTTKTGYLNKRIIVTGSDSSGIVIKMIAQDAGTVTDIDGNSYHAIRIGNQIWTVENLKTTKHNDGTEIKNISDDTTWKYDTLGAYCYHRNDETIAKKYGVLYNWHAIHTGKLAPTGWHVPTDAEWDTLRNYLIESGYNWDGTTTVNKIGKSMATKTDWTSYDTLGCVGNGLSSNNTSGFSGLPGSYRRNNGYFSYIGDTGLWWSSTEKNSSDAYSFDLYYHYAFLYKETYSKGYGLSVRLVKDYH